MGSPFNGTYANTNDYLEGPGLVCASIAIAGERSQEGLCKFTSTESGLFFAIVTVIQLCTLLSFGGRSSARVIAASTQGPRSVEKLTNVVQANEEAHRKTPPGLPILDTLKCWIQGIFSGSSRLYGKTPRRSTVDMRSFASAPDNKNETTHWRKRHDRTTLSWFGRKMRACLPSFCMLGKLRERPVRKITVDMAAAANKVAKESSMTPSALSRNATGKLKLEPITRSQSSVIFPGGGSPKHGQIAKPLKQPVQPGNNVRKIPSKDHSEFASTILSKLQNERHDKATAQGWNDNVRLFAIYAPLAICNLLGNITTFPSQVWQGAVANLMLLVYAVASAEHSIATGLHAARFRYNLQIDPDTAASGIQGLSRADARVMRFAIVFVRVLAFVLAVLWVCCTLGFTKRLVLVIVCKALLLIVWASEGYIVVIWRISVIKEVSLVHRRVMPKSVAVSSRREHIIRGKTLEALQLMLVTIAMATMQLSYFVSLSMLNSSRLLTYYTIEIGLVMGMAVIRTHHASKRLWKKAAESTEKKLTRKRIAPMQTDVSFVSDIQTQTSHVGLFDEFVEAASPKNKPGNIIRMMSSMRMSLG